MKLTYTDKDGRKQVYPHDFVSVREALHIAANTGYILDCAELHITKEAAKETAAPDKKKEAADGKDKAV
jgi:hypothetical protein